VGSLHEAGTNPEFSFICWNPERIKEAKMPAPLLDNLGGHRSKYEILKASMPEAEVGVVYTGSTPGSGTLLINAVKAYVNLKDAKVIDVGCGIGRLTEHLMKEPIQSYLGTDIIPEIMKNAQDKSAEDQRFSFSIVDSCSIPAADNSTDLVVSFSVITHLIDEEVLRYFLEAKRVLRTGGTAIFSFMDFDLPAHQEVFFRHAPVFETGHGDLLKFTTKSVLAIFSQHAGMETVDFADALVGQSCCIMRA
jgi:SAM-dependent methyltransferase